MENNTNHKETTERLTGKARRLANLTHKLTKEDQIKGGSNPPITNTLIHRIWCRPTCKLFPCPFQPLSDTQYEGKCALKQQKLHTQKQMLDIFTKGEKGLVQELTRTISNISLKAKAEGTLKAIREYHADLLNYGKFVHGEKIRTKIDATVDTRQNITIEDLRKIVKNRKKPEEGQ